MNAINGAVQLQVIILFERELFEGWNIFYSCTKYEPCYFSELMVLISFAGHVNVAPRHLTAEAETLLSATLIHEVCGFHAYFG